MIHGVGLGKRLELPGLPAVHALAAASYSIFSRFNDGTFTFLGRLEDTRQQVAKLQATGDPKKRIGVVDRGSGLGNLKISPR